MNDSTPEPPSAPTSDFVKTHCRICAAGQTITRVAPEGEATYCLLLREWMTTPDGRAFITKCDRFELREEVTPA